MFGFDSQSERKRTQSRIVQCGHAPRIVQCGHAPRIVQCGHAPRIGCGSLLPRCKNNNLVIELRKKNGRPIMPDNVYKNIFQKIRKMTSVCFYSIWFWMIMLLPMSFILILCAGHIPGFADFYCNYIYRYISIFWNNISGLIPLSLAEVLIVALPFIAVIYFVLVIVRTVRRKDSRKKILFRGVLRVVSICCAVFFLFITNCGINYHCINFAEKIGLEVKKTSTDQLYEVCVYLAENASECRSRLKEDSNGHMILERQPAYKTAASAVNGLHKKYSFVPEGYSVPKPVILSIGMSYLNITGIYFPFTFEANVNVDVPDFTIPFSMCHELAHVRGFMSEHDANFISYLSCIYSGNDEFMYSGYVSAMLYASNALYNTDKEKFSDFLEYISDDVLDDLDEYSEYWSKFETPVAEAAASLNDNYLKSNSQSSGIKSYGEMTDLVIAHYFQEITNKIL